MEPVYLLPERDEPSRRPKPPMSHQRSVSLVEQTAASLLLPLPSGSDKIEEGTRPRGMSLPHGNSPTEGTKQRRRGMSFLHLNMPDPSGWTGGPSTGGFSALYNQLQHLPVPTFTFSAPMDDGSGNMGGRKFSFGLRRLSQTVSSCVLSCFNSYGWLT